MCGRYVSPGDAAIERFFRIDRRTPHPFVTRYNVAPTTIVPVLVQAPDGAVELLPARWGLVPHWWNKPKMPALSFNARSEEAAGKPMWREPLRHSRCLMPALGWYEWQERDPATGAELQVRPPHFLHPANDEVVGFAGLVSHWRRPDGESLLTCALMSRAAAPAVSGVHDRMPVVLQPRDYAAWLDRGLDDPAELQSMIGRARDEFAFHAVSRRVNDARNDGPELLQPPEPLLL